MKGNLLYSKPTDLYIIHLYIIQKHLGWCLANNWTSYPTQVETLRLTLQMVTKAFNNTCKSTVIRHQCVNKQYFH